MIDLWLIPLELGAEAEVEMLSWLGACLEPVFGLRAHVLKEGLDIRACRHAGRDQHDASAVITALLQRPETGYVLGVTSRDLFLPVFTFVIGEACLGGRASVVSTYRLMDERYGLPPDPDRLCGRLLTEAVHELGHCHGLRHCVDSRCVMHGSAAAEDVDLKGYELCRACDRVVAKLRRSRH